MAKTVCLACDKCYLDSLPRCPHCQTTNFFADPDDEVVAKAVNILVEEMKQDINKTEAERAKEKAEKMRELEHVRSILIEKPTPWYSRILRGFFRKTA